MVWIEAVLALHIINTVRGHVDEWTRTKPVITCSGQDQLIKFTFAESFDMFSAVTWVFKPNLYILPSPYIGFYSKNNRWNGFQIAEERYHDRIEWFHRKLSFTLLNVSTHDSGVYDVSFTVINSHIRSSKIENSSFRLDVKDPCITDNGTVRGCTELTCSTQELNPQYSWNGDAASKTTATVIVCPKQETDYQCCIDAQKTRCSDFIKVAAGNTSGSEHTRIIVGVTVSVIFVGVVVCIGIILYYSYRVQQYFTNTFDCLRFNLDEQAADTTTNEHAADTTADEQAVDTSTDEQAADTGCHHCTNYEQAADTTTDEHAADTTADEQAADTTTDEQAADKTTDEHAPDRTSDEHAGDTTSDDHADDTTTDEQAANTTTDEQAADTTTDEQAADTTTDEQDADTTDEHAADTTSDEQAADTTTDEHAADTTTDEHAADTTTDEHAADTSLDEQQ